MTNVYFVIVSKMHSRFNFFLLNKMGRGGGEIEWNLRCDPQICMYEEASSDDSWQSLQQQHTFTLNVQKISQLATIRFIHHKSWNRLRSKHSIKKSLYRVLWKTIRCFYCKLYFVIKLVFSSSSFLDQIKKIPGLRMVEHE